MLSVSDPRGDLVSASKEEDWFDGATPAPKQEHGDITGIQVQHTATEIQVTLTFADLHRQSPGRFWPILRTGVTVRTDTGLTRDVELWIRNEDSTRPTMSMLSSTAEPVGCALEYSTDIDLGKVIESIPRECLEDPTWVRVSVNSLTFQADKLTMTLDEALVEGYAASREARFSPKLYAP
jgi:hypothetical protein